MTRWMLAALVWMLTVPAFGAEPATPSATPASPTSVAPVPSSHAADTTADTTAAPASFKGLYEALKLPELRWLPEPYLPGTAAPYPTDAWVTPPAKKKLLDPLFEPTMLIRPLYVWTQQDSFTDANGVTHHTTDLRRTYLGHRIGFVLENAEVGFKGRHNDTGLYYGVKLEFVPREKDGTKSESDYLKEIVLGWNYYSLVDVAVGRIKPTLSQANLKSTPDMPLIYSPLLDTLLPKRLLGATLALSDPGKIVKLSGGVFNSVKEPYEQPASADQLFYSARAELQLSRILEVAGLPTGRVFRLQAGASYAYCKENYDPRTKMQYRGLDGHLDLFLLTLESELLIKDYYIDATNGKIAHQGKAWHVDGTVHAWPSVLDVTVRYEMADNDTKSHMDFAETASMAVDQNKRWITAGLMLHATRQLDIEVNYVMRGEAEGRSLNNDMFLTMLQFSL